MLTTTMQQLLDIMFFHYVRIMIVLSILVLMIGLPLYYLARYKGNIQKRMKQMETRFSKGMVYRDNKKNTTRRNNKMTIRCMELDPNFVKECSTQQHSWQLLSLGQYLSTLQLITENNNECQDDDSSNNTNVAITKLLTRELEATIGGVLLKHLGRNLGAALLPMLGITQFESVLAKVATNLASWVAAHILVDMAEKEEDWDPTLTDRAAFPFTLAEIISFANLNQKIRSSPPQNGNNNNHPSSLEWMRRGEIGYDPSFAAAVGVSCSNNTNNTHSTAAASKKIEGEGSNDKECNDNNSPQGNDDEFDAEDLIPNPFIVEEHFEAAIYGMEGRMRLQQEVISATRPAANAERTTATTDTNYYPEDRSLPPPTPIDERLLPGLHMGWGDAKCTHTKREIIRNRLFACLLNKLSYNYYRKEQLQQADNDDDDDLFVAKLNGKDCKYPDELIQALLDSGHTIQICPRSCITTFGIAACVKEDDGTWSNIPIGFFFRTGFERFDGRPAYFVAPHGGLDMSIEGPLVGTNHKTGKSNKCDVQFYVAIEGMCGWHSNHNADVPWVKSTSTTDIYDEGQSLQAVRMAGLLSTTFNSIATEMNLPFGGYGVLGVCNDSAALIDFALRGETNMYPLISTGRFLMHSARRLMLLREYLRNCQNQQPDNNSLELAIHDIRLLITAACNMGSDIHNSPCHLVDATSRYLANYPVSYFQLTQDSKEMMTKVAKLYEEFVHVEGGHREKSSTSIPREKEEEQTPNFLDFVFHNRGPPKK